MLENTKYLIYSILKMRNRAQIVVKPMFINKKQNFSLSFSYFRKQLKHMHENIQPQKQTGDGGLTSA